MPSAVSATGSMSQLISAAAATQGEAASIIPSQGRGSTVRTWAQTASRNSPPSRTVLTSRKRSVDSACCSAVRPVPWAPPSSRVRIRSSSRNQPVRTGYSSTG